MAYALIGYAMLFGNEHAGMDGIIDLETRQRLWSIVADRIEQKDMSHVVANLELNKPKYDTTILESKDKKEIAKSSSGRWRAALLGFMRKKEFRWTIEVARMWR